ncbi:MAG: hypothetical protein Q4G05_02210 [Clostridia bacterium]|nr:hypothetical protein [Clostridia bacterium]
MLGIDLNSTRVKSALKKMFKEGATLDKLKISLDEIEALKQYGLKVESFTGTDFYYINTTSDANFIHKSDKSKIVITEKWLEISDLWVGSMFFDEASLRYMLKEATENKFYDVYIAGNLTFGHPRFLNNSININQELKTSFEQAKFLAGIFSDYPKLKYYAIHGSRDKSFENHGELNPLLFISKELSENGIDFTYIDSYTLNILINGGIKRMTSLEKNKNTYTKSYPIDLYTRNQLSNIGRNMIKDNTNYKMRCLQIGNVLFDSYDYRAKMYITTSSGFVFDTEGAMQSATSIPSATFCIVDYQDTKILRFNSTVVRMPRSLKRN